MLKYEIELKKITTAIARVELQDEDELQDALLEIDNLHVEDLEPDFTWTVIGITYENEEGKKTKVDLEEFIL